MGFPEKDHLRGAGVHEVLDLTPRRTEGKRVDDQNQKSGMEGKWWLSSWHGAKTAFKGPPPPGAPVPDPSLRAAGLNFTSHPEDGADAGAEPRRRVARTPPRSVTPRSETPRSETPRRLAQASSITP